MRMAREVVHVRQRRTRDNLVAQGFEEAVGIPHECDGGSSPAACALASVSGVTIAPATSAAPSMPSVSQASPKMPGAPSRAIARARRTRHSDRRRRRRGASRCTRRPTGARAASRRQPGPCGPAALGRGRARAPRPRGRRREGERRSPRSRLLLPATGKGRRSRGSRFGRGGARRAGARRSERRGPCRPRGAPGTDQRARIARASAGVEVSPTVGPEAISAGSSPGTSDIISGSTRAGQAAAASCPPSLG